jgi:ABC-type multidrug transport system fused ATPase/permease subunit
MFFQALAFTIGAYVVAFIKGPLLTLVASASLPFILITYGILVPPFIKIHNATEKLHEDASAIAFEMFSSVRVVVAFGAEAKLARQHEVVLEKAAKTGKKATIWFGLMMSPTMMSTFGTFAIAFWFGIKRYSEGKITDVGDIVVVLFSVMMAITNISRLVSPIIAIAKASSAATELFVTIDAPVPNTAGFKEPEVTADADIVFHNVSFSYPSRPNVQILEGLDLTVETGKVTAIVGPSGSGKSTIVGLTERWYDLNGTTAVEKIKDSAGEVPQTGVPDPDEEKTDTKKSRWFAKGTTRKGKDAKAPAKKSGDAKKDEEDVELGPNTCTGTIRIGATDLREVDVKWWRSQIGLVQQEPFLFNDTLYNNIAFGLSGTSYGDLPKEEKLKMVEEACREAYAEEFIKKLPEGYETLVGESGIKLSGELYTPAVARVVFTYPNQIRWTTSENLYCT